MTRDPKRVVLGMSGGVDSSVAAGLLVEQGYDVIGITIKTYRYEDVGGNVGNDSTCCSLDGINDARRVCQKLGIAHYTVDFSETFRENVIDYFIEDYLAGNTPNPCVRCNRQIKWAEMLRKADSLGAGFIAMGHYASICKDEVTGRHWIQRSPDAQKDQSYMLWNVREEHLARTLFPLAGFTKSESRAHGERLGLPLRSKPESYEICFIPDNDYRRFLKDNASEALAEKAGQGAIMLDGERIGTHEGYPFYTTGQRKGLGVAHSEPLYVLNVLANENIVELGTEDKLVHHGLVATDVNMMKYADLADPKELRVKIRYHDEGAPAVCWTDEGLLHIRFVEGRKAITPGQSVVMYEGDDVVGGGIIRNWVDVTA